VGGVAPSARIPIVTEGRQRFTVALGGDIQAQAVEDGGHDVDVLGERIHLPAPDRVRLGARIADDQRDMKGLVEVGVLGELPVIAELLTVVRGKHHQAVVVGAGLAQVLDEPPDLGVHLAGHAVVRRARLQHVFVAEGEIVPGVVIGVNPPAALVVEIMAEEGMLRGLGVDVGGTHRSRHVGRRVQVVIGSRRDQRRMGRQIGDV